MIVTVDAYRIFETIAYEGIETARNSDTYKTFRNINNTMKNEPIAVPYWTILDNKDDIDYVLHDHVPHGNPVYDQNIEAFLFKSLNHMFVTIPYIINTIHDHYVNDTKWRLRSLVVKRVTQLLNDTATTIDDLCECMRSIGITT